MRDTTKQAEAGVFNEAPPFMARNGTPCGDASPIRTAISARKVIARHSWRVFVFLLIGVTSRAWAAEVHSNGGGGGAWSEPATWHGRTVPGPDDTAVIASGDAVAFDRDDQGKTTCADLAIDPNGALVFKPGGKRVLCLGGAIESYGTVKIDATGDTGDAAELRFIGATPEKRTLKLVKGGSLLVYGHAEAAAGKANAVLSSWPAGAPAAANDAAASVEAVAGTMVDLQHAGVADVVIKATTIDNTGAKPNERVNISGCAFSGLARVVCNDCDTPTISGNAFTWIAAVASGSPAIHVVSCPLAEIKGNTIRGKFNSGITGQNQTDSIVTANQLESCAVGINWHGVNAMIKDNTVRGCDTGLVLTSMSGSVEGVKIEGAQAAVSVAASTVQCTDLEIGKPAKPGPLITVNGGSMTLLNCNLAPEQIKVAGGGPAGPRVLARQFVVVAVKGRVPRGAQAEVTTAKPAVALKPGAVDLNISNSPAMILSNGLTPPPRTLKALIVKSWVIESDGKVTPPPEYDLTIVEPSPDPDAEGRKIKTVTITPQSAWFRAKPDAPTPTVEVTLP